jgi:hypothetical protein
MIGLGIVHVHRKGHMHDDMHPPLMLVEVEVNHVLHKQSQGVLLPHDKNGHNIGISDANLSAQM